jgi:hypothetical protein
MNSRIEDSADKNSSVFVSLGVSAWTKKKKERGFLSYGAFASALVIAGGGNST